jgi:hypothetical protein
MDKRLEIEIADLTPGTELGDDQLRAVVGAQRPNQVASTCHISGGVDCD